MLLISLVNSVKFPRLSRTVFAEQALIFCYLANIGRVRSTLAVAFNYGRFENRLRRAGSAVLTEYLKAQEALQKSGAV